MLSTMSILHKGLVLGYNMNQEIAVQILFYACELAIINTEQSKINDVGLSYRTNRDLVDSILLDKEDSSVENSWRNS